MMEKDEQVIGWGTKIGEFTDVTSSVDSILEDLKNYFHACHCMLFANHSQLIIGEFKPRATVLMQMRFDGHFGFPGGLVEEGESLAEGLNREMTEEVGSPPGKPWNVAMSDHVSSHVSHAKLLAVHFFAKQISLEEMRQVELASLSAKDFGSEAMGLVRIPLYTMADGFRGLPAFLSNNFIGVSKEQLLRGLELKNILTSEEIKIALKAQPQFIKEK